MSLLKRRTLVPLATIALLGLVAFLVSSAIASRLRPPRGVVTPEHQRLVAEWPPEDLIATYVVQNAGGKTLVLGEPSTTCSCTVAAIDPPILGPGQEGAITLKGNPPDAGERTVTIISA